MSKSKPWNGKTSSQDYTNLLFSDSESDHVPDLKLPPLKNKKPKRRSVSRRQSEENGCSLWITLSVVTVTILLISIIFLGVTTYWTWQQITELKDQINTLENKNAGTPEEFQALQSKLTSVNKTVTELKTGKYGLDVLNQSILEMQKKITSLSTSASKFQQSIQPADTDEKRKILTNTVAELGSDLKSARADVDTLKTAQATLTTQFENLANRVGKLEMLTRHVTKMEKMTKEGLNPGGREGGSAAAPVSADIQELLTQMNTSFMQNIGKATQDVSKLQTHVDAVEKFTQSLQEQLKNVSQQLVNVTRTQALIQDTIKTPPGTKTAEDDSTKAEGQSLLSELQDQVEHLQQVVEKMQSDAKNQTTAVGEGSTMTSSDVEMLKKDHSDFMAFRTEVFQDITSLNATLASLDNSFGTLNGDVGVLFDKMNLTMLELSNVTSVVEGLANILQAQKEAAAAVSKQPNSAPEKSEDTTPDTDKSAADLNNPERVNEAEEAHSGPESPGKSQSSSTFHSKSGNTTGDV